MPKDLDELIEELKEELNEYAIGDYDLDEVFEPLFNACAKVAKNRRELKQCIIEGITTLKNIVKKI